MAKGEQNNPVAVLPVIVTRCFKKEGAVLVGVTIGDMESADWMSHFKGVVGDWNWGDIMNQATDGMPFSWMHPEEVFTVEDGKESMRGSMTHVTMVYPLFIDKRSSDLIDILDTITGVNGAINGYMFEYALQKLISIRCCNRKRRSPIDSPFQTILNYIASCVARFQIPQMIPYGKSEKDFWPAKLW